LSRGRFAGISVIAFICAMLLPAAATAQTSGNESLVTRIREVSFDSSGNTRLVVSVAGTAITSSTALTADDFTVKEQGLEVGGLAVSPLAESRTPIAVVLVMDTSESMAGPKLAAAKLAALEFIASMPSNVRAAVINFGTTVTVTQDFTTNHAPLNTAINSLQVQGRTALYDAVVAATTLLSRQANIQHNVVVLSDGGDSDSKGKLSDVLSALQTTSTPATTVLIGPPSAGQAILQQIADAVKGGDALLVSDTAKLRAAFALAGQAVSSQYALTYPGKDKFTKDLNISVTATVSGFTASDSSSVINKRQQAQPETGPRPAPKPLVGAFGGNLGLYLGIFAAFVAAALFFGMLLWAPVGRAGDRALARRLRLYTRGADRKGKKETTGSALSASAVGRRALSVVDKLPRPKNFDENMQKELDQAGWPLRSSEFIILQFGAFILGLLIGGVLLRRLWMGIVFGVVGAVLPRLLLTAQINRRSSQFLSQLPDTLQLLAGSLSAGYGFLQALDTIAKETVAPTSVEFARVLSEARLGRALEDALDSMAERVGGEDFRWVVLAINIQRQVGGNLAQLLTTVATTLREREQVRRQIKVLSAEGKLSAYILVALPFVLFGYLSLINPQYIHQLTNATIGKIMLIGAIVLIGIGGLWMRKMIKIDV
jgi:tight adherence protein B